MAQANASAKAAQKARKAAVASAVAAKDAEEQRKRDEALRNAEVQLPKQPPSQQTFAF